MDFGPSASDYARFRQGFPDSFFERVALSGDVLDLGAGTGALSRGYARRGARVTALDLSPAMLREAADLQRRVAGRAEACPFRDRAFDAITAGQCWHWFDRPAAAAECRRLLRPGGQLVLASFNYQPHPGTVPQVSEALLLERHPAWPWAGMFRMPGRYDHDLAAAGFAGLREVAYEVEVRYDRAGWLGRMRACNGVLALRDPAAIAEYEAALARALRERFPERFGVLHEVFALVATAP
ncbi:MAG TPA: class I SAM-dependent methyltransferase [Anaeromyxobacteraceae bacterium]